jgi:hypothetical protein
MGISGVKWATSKHDRPSMRFEIVLLILNIIMQLIIIGILKG